MFIGHGKQKDLPELEVYEVRCDLGNMPTPSSIYSVLYQILRLNVLAQ